MQFSLSFLSLPQKYCFLRRPPSILSKNCKNMGFKKILMIREGKEKERKEKEREKKREREENRKTRGLTGLTVNSCFFYLPLAYLIIFKYIYLFLYMCGR